MGLVLYKNLLFHISFVVRICACRLCNMLPDRKYEKKKILLVVCLNKNYTSKDTLNPITGEKTDTIPY